MDKICARLDTLTEGVVKRFAGRSSITESEACEAVCTTLNQELACKRSAESVGVGSVTDEEHEDLYCLLHCELVCRVHKLVPIDGR